MKKVSVIFDIGKTNKKCLVFNENYSVDSIVKMSFEPTIDDDGDPSEDLHSVIDWISKTLNRILNSQDYTVTYLNFTTYGATLVHLDNNLKIISPIYSYTKEFPESLTRLFLSRYSDVVEVEAAAPLEGMLNSALQLFWIKNNKPEKFRRIHHSVHFPQFLSFLFTKKLFSGICSIGCHTFLWDYSRNQYHNWVKSEDFANLLPPIVPMWHTEKATVDGKEINTGIGIHDSSAALIPYLKLMPEPFILVSTGTWCVALNPFNNQDFSREMLDQQCLNYMSYEQKPVRAAKLFMGFEHELQLNKLLLLFNLDQEYLETFKLNLNVFTAIAHDSCSYFKFENLPNCDPLQPFDDDWDFEHCYYRLIYELVSILVRTIGIAKGNDEFSNLIVDGGFVKNTIFLYALQSRLNGWNIFISNCTYGSALGALLVGQPSLNMAVLESALNIQKLNFN